MKKYILLAITIFLFASSIVSAQQTSPKTISAGVVNGKAIELAKPEYTAAAMAVRASGEVKVQVTIDEQGNVISAKAVSGHTLLRASAEQAALKSKFKPTYLSGQAVKVSGVIIYNFVPTQSNEERVKTLEVATFLLLVRSSATDLEKLNLFFEAQDFIKESLEDLPNFAKELAPLASLKNTPSNKRLEIIDDVIASIRDKLSANEAWQFALGENFGEFLAQIISAMTEDGFDVSKLSESNLRLNLTRISELTDSAPSDFPTDVLEKFKEFSTIKDKASLVSLESLQELLMKAGAIIETISPDVAK